MNKLRNLIILGVIAFSLVTSGCGEDPQQKYLEKWSSLTYWKSVSVDEVRAGLKAGMKVDYELENGHTPLVMAALFNKSPEVIEELVKAGASTGVSKAGQSPLMAAASRNPNPEIVKTLLKHNADTNVRGINGITALILAAESCSDVEIFKLLVDAGADLKAQLNDGQTVEQMARRNFKCGPKIMEYLNERGAVSASTLHASADDLALFAARGNIDRVRALIESGSHPDLTGKTRGLPLHQALRAETVNHEMVKLLLEKGANPNLTDETGDNALLLFFKSVFSTKIDEYYEKFMGARDAFAEIGIDIKPDYKGIKPQYGKRSYGFGFNENFLEIMDLMKKAKADFSAADKYGNNILHLAAMGGASLKAIKALNETGADMRQQNRSGYTPVELLLIRSESLEELQKNLGELGIELSDNSAENIDLTYKLIGNGLFGPEVFAMAGPNAGGLVNKDGRSFFHAAAGNPAIDNDAVGSIFSKGFLMNAEDTYGQTPFMAGILADDGKNGRVKWLLERGVDLTKADKDSRNILHYFAMNDRAAFPENEEIISKLINTQNYLGETPLITALKHDQPGAVSRLIRAGATILLKDNKKKTALDYDQNGTIFSFCYKDFKEGQQAGIEAFKNLTPFQYFQLRCVPKAEELGGAEGMLEFVREIQAYIDRHKLQKFVDESLAEKPIQD